MWTCLLYQILNTYLWISPSETNSTKPPNSKLNSQTQILSSYSHAEIPLSALQNSSSWGGSCQVQRTPIAETLKGTLNIQKWVQSAIDFWYLDKGQHSTGVSLYQKEQFPLFWQKDMWWPSHVKAHAGPVSFSITSPGYTFQSPGWHLSPAYLLSPSWIPSSSPQLLILL